MPDSGIAALPVAREDYEQFQNDETSRDAQQKIGTAFDHADAVAKVGAAFDDAQKQAEQHSTAQQAGEVAKAAAGKVYDAYQTASEDAKPYIDQIGQAFSRATKPDPDTATYADQLGKAFAAAPAMPQGTAAVPAGGGEQERTLALQAAQKYNLDPSIFLAQGQQESGLQHVDPATGNVKTSSAGALGAYQLMPDTAKGLGVDPTDLAQNVEGGARLMRQLLDRYGGDYTKALAAYNAGPGAVDQAGGVPDFPETRAYVRRILSAQSGGGGAAGGGVGGGGTGRVDARGVEAQSQFGLGLPDDQAAAFCGPVAAIAFSQANGRNPTVEEAKQLAAQVGWTPQGGMNGVANEQALLTRMGVASRLDQNPDFGQIAQDASTGNPVIVSTDKHYYFVNGFDPNTGKLRVMKTGTNRRGGAEWMSAQEIADLDGGINGALYVDNPNSPHPSVGATPAANQGQFGPADEGLTADEGGQPVAPVESGADIAARMTGTGAKAADPLGQPLDTSSVGGFLRSIVPGLLHLLGGGQATTPAPDTEATSPAITAPNGVPAEASGIAPTSIGDAFKRAMDQAQSPDVPGLPLAGLPRLFPYQPGKPTQPPQDVSEKITTGQPLDAGDFVAGLTKTAMAQGTSPAAAAASEGLEDVVGPLAHVAGPMGPRIGTPEEDLARAFAQGRTEGSAAGGLGAGVRSAGEAAAGGGDALRAATEPEARRMFHGTGSPFDRPEAAKFNDGTFGPAYYGSDHPGVATTWATGPDGGREGANVRAFDLPGNANLLKADDAVPDPVVERVFRAVTEAVGDERTARADFFGGIARSRSSSTDPTIYGEDLYRGVERALGGKEAANGLLSRLGFDGVEFEGSTRGMVTPDGQAEPNTSVAIFPESLPKLRNALSGTQGGQIDPRYAVHAATTAAGGVGGYATQEPQQPGESDAAYAARVAGATGAGALLGLGAGALGTRLLGGRGTAAALEPTASPIRQKVLDMYEKSDFSSDTPTVADRLEALRRSFVRAWTDRGVDLAEFQKLAQSHLGRPLNADEMASELSRLNPDRAAEVRLQEGLRPALQAVGDDRRYLSEYLTYQDNIDTARVMGARVEREGQPDPAKASRWTAPLETAQENVRQIEEMAQNDPETLGIKEELAAARQRVRTLQSRVANDIQADIGRVESGTMEARAAGEEAAANRQFSAGLNVADSQRGLADMAAELPPERMQTIERAAQQVWDFGKSMLRQKLNAGIIDQELFDQLTDPATGYPHYSPTRIIDYLKDDAPGLANGKSLSLRDSGLRRNTVEGTAQKREDPIASMVRLAYDTQSAVMRNDAFNAFVKLRDAIPGMDESIRPVPTGYTTKRGEQLVTGFVDGVKQTYAMPEDLAMAVKQEPIAAPLKPVQIAMSLFKTLATSRNPVFLVSNAVNDSLSYFIRESARAGGPQAVPRAAVDLAKAYVDAFGGLLSGTYRGATADFLREGGGQFGFFERGLGETKQAVDELARRNAFVVNSPQDLKRLAKAAITLQPVETIGERIELAPRVAAFQRAQRAGLNTPESVVRGRSVTLDFAQGGTWAKVINGFVPFFNAGTQAATVPARVVAENPRGALLTGMGLLVAPVVAAEAWNRADPQRQQDYADVPQYLKDGGVVVMLPGEAPLDQNGERRPQFVYLRTREFSPIVALTREVYDRVAGDDPRAAADLLGNAYSQISPVQGLSNLVLPGISTGLELQQNRDFYRNRPIVSNRGDQNASALGQAVAGGINDFAASRDLYPDVHPSQADFAVRSLASGVGGAVLGASDALAGRTKDSEAPQDRPVVGGAYSRVIRGDTGQRLQDAQANTLSPEAQGLLYDAGLKYQVQPVSGQVTVDGVKVQLTRDEEADYQDRANALLDQAIRSKAAVLRSPLPAEQRQKVLDRLVADSRARAWAQTERSFPPGELNRRVREQRLAVAG